MPAQSSVIPIVLACALAFGCASRVPMPAQTSPPIAGTLYVTHLSQRGSAPDISIVRDGVVMPNPAPSGVLIAREKPSIIFPTLQLHGRRPCEPVAISPRGIYGACLRADGRGSVILFAIASPSAQRESAAHVRVNTAHMIGFLNDGELAVAADDDTCPSYARGDAVYSYEPRSRLWELRTDGSIMRKGPCVHGIVVGDKRIALLFHDPKEQPEFSFDGSTWQPGFPVTFDGDDHLLIINKWDQLVDEQGRLVATDVVDASWTR